MNVAMMLLTGNVKLWWRNRVVNLAVGRTIENIKN
jgi:hypothetical protein